jgi:hypothetical protein
MKIVCSYCEKVYQVPDHKIPLGKKLTAKCKVCGNGIVVERKPRTARKKETPPEPPAMQPDTTSQEREIEDDIISSIQSVDSRGVLGDFFADQRRIAVVVALSMCVIVAVSLLGKGLYSLVVGDGSRPSKRFVRQVAEEANGAFSLPVQINNQVTLTGIDAVDRELVYSYTFVNFESEDLAQLPLVTDLSSSLISPICSGDFVVKYAERGLTYRYDVYGSDNLLVSSTKADLADCR